MRAWLSGGPLGGTVREVGDAAPNELLEKDDEGRVHRYLRDPVAVMPEDVEADIAYGHAG